MNKQILLQSIKSVCGFLALLIISMLLLTFILSNVNPIIGTSLIVIGTFIGLVWFDYKTRLDRSSLDSIKRTKIQG
jgi:hypothetical protein